MTERVYNFSPGPAILPLSVLNQAQRDLVSLPTVGCSVLEISHRSPAYHQIQESASQGLKTLLGVPDDYHILFLQGGARLQFSMAPMNLLRGSGKSADYCLTGSWGKKAFEQAGREGPVRIAWDGKSHGYDRVPEPNEIDVDPTAAYVHITSNETIEGVQFTEDLDTGQVPLVCDSSSDFLCRPLSIQRYGLIYACAQKNAGPAGLTVVIIRDDLLGRSSDRLPGYLNYREHVSHGSLYNTPPVFGVYIAGLVVRWLADEVGGLEQMLAMNREKANLLYEIIDLSEGFYRGHAQPGSRSLMNVTFRLPSDLLQDEFLARAESHKLCNLKGHRSVGGLRASIYNAMPREGVAALSDFMYEFWTEKKQAQH